MSQTIQFLSMSPCDAVIVGEPQFTPSLEALVSTALPVTPPDSVRTRLETSHRPSAASYATDGSVARS